MKTLNTKTANVAELIRKYRASAVAHGAATECGKHRESNRHHDMIAEIYRELRNRGDEARSELLDLLDDINPHVRAWEAAHALDFAPDRGEPVLKRLASGKNVVAFNAAMTLQEWRNGSLTFP